MVKKLWRYVKPLSSDTGTSRTDRQTDGRTDIFAISISRVSELTRDKNVFPTACNLIAYFLPLYASVDVGCFSCLSVYISVYMHACLASGPVAAAVVACNCGDLWPKCQIVNVSAIQMSICCREHHEMSSRYLAKAVPTLKLVGSSLRLGTASPTSAPTCMMHPYVYVCPMRCRWCFAKYRSMTAGSGVGPHVW